MKVTTYDRHLEQLYEEFPDIHRRSLKGVALHALRMWSFFQLRGHDIYLNNNREGTYMYTGDVTNVVSKRYEIYNRKYKKKLRLMYSLRKEQYDGYLYFSLTEEQYQQHLETGKVDKVLLFKVFDEAKIYRLATHYFKVKRENPHKWFVIEENYETSSAEYICKRDDKGSSSDINT